MPAAAPPPSPSPSPSPSPAGAAALVAAATGPAGPGLTLRPLPAEVVTILTEVGAAPRLVAHLRAVHDVACAIVEWAATAWPGIELDADAVRLGAALHDAGKALHPAELSGPGSEHQRAGYELLLARGLPERHARFARTHGEWAAPEATIEDQLVALADKVWKGRRERDLEDLLVARVSAAGGGEPWEVFSALDDFLDGIAAAADLRLAFQSAFPTSSPR